MLRKKVCSAEIERYFFSVPKLGLRITSHYFEMKHIPTLVSIHVNFQNKAVILIKDEFLNRLRENEERQWKRKSEKKLHSFQNHLIHVMEGWTNGQSRGLTDTIFFYTITHVIFLNK